MGRSVDLIAMLSCKIMDRFSPPGVKRKTMEQKKAGHAFGITRPSHGSTFAVMESRIGSIGAVVNGSLKKQMVGNHGRFSFFILVFYVFF